MCDFLHQIPAGGAAVEVHACAAAKMALAITPGERMHDCHLIAG